MNEDKDSEKFVGSPKNTIFLRVPHFGGGGSKNMEKMSPSKIGIFSLKIQVFIIPQFLYFVNRQNSQKIGGRISHFSTPQYFPILLINQKCPILCEKHTPLVYHSQ